LEASLRKKHTHQDEGLLLGSVEDKVPQERKGPGLPRLRAELLQALQRCREVQELEQQGHVVLRSDPPGVQSLLDGGRGPGRLVALHQPTHLPQEVAHWQVRGGLAVRQGIPVRRDIS
jgi:hypothetical protein